MLIRTTTTRMTIEQAIELAGKDNNGLIGDLINKLGHKEKKTEVLKAKKFYYPYYVGGAVMKFKRAGGRISERHAAAVAVMEGGFGTVQNMKGRPAMGYEEVPLDQIVVCRFDQSDAEIRIARHMAKHGQKMYRSIPAIDFKEMYVIYKPHYACLCQKGDKRFFRVIDAEIQNRNYMLDIKFRDLTFMDKNMENNKIDKKMYSPAHGESYTLNEHNNAPQQAEENTTTENTETKESEA